MSADVVPTDAAVSRPVAVRELCEFAAKRGDLDRRFTPAPSAAQGMAGHVRVAGRRAGDYEREITLSGVIGGCAIRGRADGYDPQLHRLEEIKTHRGDVGRIPDNHRALHWAQLRVYGALFCAERGCAAIDLALVYYNVDDDSETLFAESQTADALQVIVAAMAADWQAWQQREAAHRVRRNAALDRLRFPHASFNDGQRLLANAVFRSVRDGTALMAQAPTGIGKTVGTLFPALKAMAHAPIDKLWFLTAKSPGRQVALDALVTLAVEGDDNASEPPLRVLEMVARAKACVHPDKRCNGESCPLARGFYDRLPAARAAAIAVAPLDQAGVRRVAAEHTVCPYYLSQELVRWADVVVGDVNYAFDASALLAALQAVNEWKVAMLVDEAHNLVERAREMYSGVLDEDALRAAMAAAPPALKGALRRIGAALGALGNVDDAPWRLLDEVPEPITAALAEFASAASRMLAETRDEFPPALQDFHFAALGFARLADVFGGHSMCDVSVDAPDRVKLAIRNVVPAPFLAPRFAAAHGAVLFSATLNPPVYYRDLLGLPEATPWLDVPSPFAPAQLQVRIAAHVSTRFDRREASLAPIARLIADQYCAAPGHYLAFFSSFDYLDRALAALRTQARDVPVRAQSRTMDEAARQAFLDRFDADGSGIAFAVLGGVFSEGIDLPGRRLIGAFVVTLGLPQVNPVNDAMQARMDALFGAGHEYTYLYPGLRKVVQAAGRVIRHRDDRGTVWLVDRRYARADVQALLPAWWEIGASASEARDASG